MKICFCHPVLNDYNPPIKSFFEVLCHSLSVATKLLAIKADMEFVELTYTAATRANLEAELRQADFFVFAGHSSRKGLSLTGSEKSICMDICNAGLLAGKSVYLICCHAAAGLAQELVKQGSRLCLAFDDKLYLMARKQEPVIVRCLVEGVAAMIEETEARCVLSRTAGQHERWIRNIISCYSHDEEWLLAAIALDWNMEHLNVVTRTGVMKGVSILESKGNPTPLTDEELKNGMNRLRRWVQDIGLQARQPGLVTGGEGDLSPSEILRILEQRLQRGDWGHNDAAERYLVQMARTCNPKSPK